MDTILAVILGFIIVLIALIAPLPPLIS